MKTELLDKSIDSDDLLYNLISDLEFLHYRHEIKWVKPTHFLVPEVKDFPEALQFSDFGIDVIKNFLHIGLVNLNTILDCKEILLKIWPSHLPISVYGQSAKTSLPGIKKVKTLLFYVPEKVFLTYARSPVFPRELVASAAVLTPTEEWKLLEPRVMSSFFSMIFDNPDVFEVKTARVWHDYNLEELDTAWKQLLFLCCGPFDIPYHIKKMLKRNWSSIKKRCYFDGSENGGKLTHSEGNSLLLLIQWAKFSTNYNEFLTFLKAIDTNKAATPSNVLSEAKISFTKDVSNVKKFSCSQCPYKSKWNSEMIRHMRKHSGDKPFRCEICDRAFADPKDVRKHMQLHSGVYPYQCNYCGKPFRHISNLRIHIISLHKSKGNLKMQCYSCKKIFESEAILKDHVLSHINDMKFQCLVCFKPFISKEKLDEHSRAHSEDKPYKCHICGRGYLTENGVNKHMLAHSSEAAYNCPFCRKAFRRPDSLWSHEKIVHGDQ